MNKKLQLAEVLQEDYLTQKTEYDGNFTKTSQFMVPLVGIKLSHDLVFKYFVNSYLSDIEHPHEYERPIFILFSVTSFKEADWIKIYNSLIKSPNYLTEYDVGVQDGKFLFMMVFQIPEKYKDDYLNFRLGKYSLFSDEARLMFPKYINANTKKKSTHWQIINKDPELVWIVEQKFNMPYGEWFKPTIIDGVTYPAPTEIWDKPNKKQEYYRHKQ